MSRKIECATGMSSCLPSAVVLFSAHDFNQLEAAARRKRNCKRTIEPALASFIGAAHQFDKAVKLRRRASRPSNHQTLLDGSAPNKNGHKNQRAKIIPATIAPRIIR